MTSFDPHAWLRPMYRQLAATDAFEQLAPVVQFQRLLDAAAAVSEAKAAALRQSSPAAQSALLPGRRTEAADARIAPKRAFVGLQAADFLAHSIATLNFRWIDQLIGDGPRSRALGEPQPN